MSIQMIKCKKHSWAKAIVTKTVECSECASEIKELQITPPPNTQIMQICPCCGSRVTAFQEDVIYRCNNETCQWAGKSA